MDDDVKKSLIKGLKSTPKYIPVWYAYDQTGSELHEQGCFQSPDYYITRSTTSILQSNAKDIVKLPYNLTLVELGSGNCLKTRFIIDELLKRQQKLAFYPIDISEEFLFKTAAELSTDYGDSLVVRPIAGNYMAGIEEMKRYDGPKLILFFNSIQNMPYDDQLKTLRLISTIMTDNCRLVFSADITQNKDAVLRAYYDRGQQKFVRNIFTRLNREEGGKIDPSMFRNDVEFISDKRQHRMSYVSATFQAKESVCFSLPGLGIDMEMEKDEKLYFNEGGVSSCKYTTEQLSNIVEKAGLYLEDVWTDEQNHVAFCRCKSL